MPSAHIESRRPSLRSILGKVHLWIGLALCLPLAVIGITGSILVFEPELQALERPALPPRPADAPTAPVAAIVATARAAAPADYVAMFYTAPRAATDVATVRLAPAGRPGPGAGLEIFVNPVSLSLLGPHEASSGLVRQIFLLHANLLSRDRSGRDIVGWLGIAMLALGTSGLVLWWPRGGQWRRAFTIRRGARGFRFHRELHGAAGIWGLVVFFIVSFSGVYLAFPQAVGSLLSTRDIRPGAAAIRVTPVPTAQPLDIDGAIAVAREVVPDGILRSVALPARPDQPIRVALAHGGDREGAPVATVFVDPWTRSVVELRDPRAFSAGERFVAWQRALHVGGGLGWIWRILVFLSGFLPLLFAVTGVAMWLAKRRLRRGSASYPPSANLRNERMDGITASSTD
jgi:uncharacterized iron-regulated membrane protein